LQVPERGDDDDGGGGGGTATTIASCWCSDSRLFSSNISNTLLLLLSSSSSSSLCDTKPLLLLLLLLRWWTFFGSGVSPQLGVGGVVMLRNFFRIVARQEREDREVFYFQMPKCGFGFAARREVGGMIMAMATTKT
jgi:hypothetical protein